MNAPDVRTRILREATRLFAERGVSGTSIQAIASAAGITKPTLVYHFGGKDGLRDAVLAEFMDHWRHELPKLLSAAASGGPRLDSLVEALFDFFRRDPDRARLLLRESLDRPEELRALLQDSVQPFTTLITQAMRMGQVQGAIREKVDPDAFVVLVISCAVGVVAVGPFVSGLMSPEPSVDAQQAELIRMARVALLNPPGSS